MLRKTLFFLPVICLFTFGFKSSETTKSIDFIIDDWTDAVAKSKAEHKPIFCFVYGTTCNLSKKIMAETFTEDDVIKLYNEKFVNVKLNADLTINNMRVTTWGVQGVPTMLYFNYARKVVMRATGFQDSDDLIELADGVYKDLEK